MDKKDTTLLAVSAGSFVICPPLGVLLFTIFAVRKLNDNPSAYDNLNNKAHKEGRIISDTRFENCDIVITDDSERDKSDFNNY